MNILDDLHVVRWNNNADIAQGLHLATLKSRKTDGSGSTTAGHLQSTNYISGTSAATDCDSHVTGLDEITQRFSENIVVRTIVCPGGENRDIIGQSNDPKPRAAATLGRSLAEVTGKM